MGRPRPATRPNLVVARRFRQCAGASTGADSPRMWTSPSQTRGFRDTGGSATLPGTYRTRFMLIHGKEDEPQDETISFSAQVAPRVLRFLKTVL